MLEFTGERVIPGLVDPNLFNEHLARYRFAALFAEGKHALDAGCGSGYGTAELSSASCVVAIDNSAGAVQHAREKFSRPGVRFLQSQCEALPFADASFDLLVAFEVIEHIERWKEMLTEARRVLRPAGILLVSTPNKDWYAESRGGAGANPYHVHEFGYREFEAELGRVFPHIRLWTQNHSEAIAFVSATPSQGIFDAGTDTTPEHAHFFLAACSQSPIGERRSFAWLPSAGNVLRERQHHISLLESEIGQKDKWLAKTTAALAKLQTEHEDLLAELQERNRWAEQLNGDLDLSRGLIAELQQELKTIHSAYQEHLARLEAEAARRLDWVRDLEAQITRGRAEIDRQSHENRELEGTIAERTAWARSLDAELERARAELRAIEDTKLVRLGRKVRLLPMRPIPRQTGQQE